MSSELKKGIINPSNLKGIEEIMSIAKSPLRYLLAINFLLVTSSPAGLMKPVLNATTMSIRKMSVIKVSAKK